MNEMMYEKNEAVKKLNAVEGFEPKDYLRKEATEDGESLYLDTKYRQLWFRLKYPNGKIVKIPKVLNKDYATFEVRVYADKNDAADDFLANGFASRYKDESNEKFGMNFVETAETAAKGRALNDAGFGTQFCDIAIPNDASIVDAGVTISFDVPSAPDTDGDDTVEETTEAVAVTAEPVSEPIKLTPDMPVDELMSKMTLDYAKGIVVDYGYDTGKTLEYLAVNKPNSLQFHATRSTNNLIKAGAMFMLEQAKMA